MKIKQPAAAGKFYSNIKNELSEQLDEFIRNTPKKCDLAKYDVSLCDYSTRAIIVPHAGYIYSGELACAGFQHLNKDLKNIFIIAPPHYVAVRNVALSSYDQWSTPLGEISINKKINDELIEKFDCELQDDAFEQEHSAEVQVPFIQKFFPDAKIIPILAGNQQKVQDIISYYWNDPKNGFVISSDLSHFNHSNEARRLDEITAKMIEFKAADEMVSAQACGACGIKALVGFAKNKNYSLIRIGMNNSGDMTNDHSRVVGYGAWFLYEGAKNIFLKKYYSKLIIEICKKSILARLEGKTYKPEHVPAVFGEMGACFVTLEKENDLRGCIGSIVAHRSLIEDLIYNAQSSAFSDPRFQPLKQEEFHKVSINVSLLSEPEKMRFTSEADLLEQITPFVDGIIIKDGNYQAVYLPSVWEQLPDKVTFLKSLKIKAGMTPEHFSKTFEVFRFYTEYVEE